MHLYANVCKKCFYIDFLKKLLDKRFLFFNVSEILETFRIFNRMSSGPTKPIATIAGNSGGPIGPVQLTGNLDLIGVNGVSVSGGGNTLTITGSGGALSTLTGNTGGAINPSGNNINVVGSGAVSVTGSGNTLTLSSSGTGLAWNNHAITQTMVTNSGYIVTAGAPVFTLPIVSSVGDIIELILNGGTSWKIAQGAGQWVVVNNSQSTVGATGSISSSGSGVTIRLICTATNIQWQADSLVGSTTVV